MEEAKVAVAEDLVLDFAGLFAPEKGADNAEKSPVETILEGEQYKTITEHKNPVETPPEGLEGQQAKGFVENTITGSLINSPFIQANNGGIIILNCAGASETLRLIGSLGANNNNLKVLDSSITFEYNRSGEEERRLHTIHFYRDKSGNQPVADYIRELAGKSDKDSRIKLHKIQDYINALSEYGLQLKEPHIKHLDGEIWELRPLRDRILFVAWHNGSFVLLHQFMKKTQKTPAREIEKAKRELADLIERGVEDE